MKAYALLKGFGHKDRCLYLNDTPFFSLGSRTQIVLSIDEVLEAITKYVGDFPTWSIALISGTLIASLLLTVDQIPVLRKYLEEGRELEICGGWHQSTGRWIHKMVVYTVEVPNQSS